MFRQWRSCWGNRVAGVLVVLAIAENLPAVRAESIDTTKETFIYKKLETRELRIDWVKPVDWKPSDHRGAIVFIHGGGWVGGSPKQFAPHSEELARLGIVCFNVEYRLLDRKSSEPPDACVEDVSDAFRFVRGHADELGIDPKRIAAGGGSAGGHLAAYLGMMEDQPVDGISRKPNALLLFNPVYDNGPGEWGHGRVGEAYRQYSPAHNISSDDPPAIVFLGTEDKLIPVATAERFRHEMKSHDVRSELRLYEGQPHGFFNANKTNSKHYRETLDASIEFLQSLDWFQEPIR